MRWLRGNDEDTSSTSMMSAGLAEIAGLFQPTRHKQTEHIEEQKRLCLDVANATEIDLDRGVLVIRRQPAPTVDAPADPPPRVASATPATLDEAAADGVPPAAAG